MKSAVKIEVAIEPDILKTIKDSIKEDEDLTLEGELQKFLGVVIQNAEIVK